MKRVLIADDSGFMRESMRDILEHAGYKVIGEALNAGNAVELYRALRPDIVMLDVSMPDISGIEALRQIIEIDPDAVVIMMTVVGKPDIVLESLNNGARSYLTKPFEEDSVLHALQSATKK